MNMKNFEEGSSLNNSEINIGIIGAGWWSCQSHIPALLACGVKNIFITNRTDSKFSKIKQEFENIEHCYTDVEEMFKNHEIHGVIIASSHVAHYDNSVEALKRGIPALIDKPMCTKSCESKALVELAKKNSTDIMIPHGFNFARPVIEAKRLIENIGEIHHVSMQVASALLDLFSSKEMEETKDHLFRPSVDTWSDPDNAGGYAWGQLTHLLGIFFLLVDDDPKEIFAYTNNSSSGVDMYNTIAGKLKKGATLSISGSGSVPKSLDIQIELKIFGEKGMFVLDLEDGRERLETTLHNGERESVKITREECRYDGMTPIEPFIRLCKNDLKENYADGVLGSRSVSLVEAMYESANSRKIVEIKS